MSRIRTTSRTLNLNATPGAQTSRRAAPNQFSGHNPNTPINLYDTHPNARFAMGEDVMHYDQMANNVSIIGSVLGHVAEDRLLVQWPNMVSQEDAEDLIAVRETPWGRFRSSSKNRKASTERISLFENINPWSQKNKDKGLRKKLVKEHGGGEEHQAVMNFNLFENPEVVTFLKRYGISDREVQNYATLRQNQLSHMREKYDKASKQIGEGDFSQFSPENRKKNVPTFGGGSGRRFEIQKPQKQLPAQRPRPRSSSGASSSAHISKSTAGLSSPSGS